VDHFRATCRVGKSEKQTAAAAHAVEAVPLDPGRDLYGRILFHSGRFRRLRGYRLLRARECVAEIAPAGTEPWFWRYLPSAVMLGDPGARDAAIHAIQACIPQSTLLPTGVERIVTSRLPDSAALLVHARERERSGDTFVYDVEIADADGRVVERWCGLRLQRVGDIADAGDLAPSLLGPYLERRVQEVMPAWRAAIAVESGDESDRAMQRAVGVPTPILRRSDGKPEIAHDGWQVSASHSGGLLLAVAGREQVSCDAEEVIARPRHVWRDLLGPDRFALAEWMATPTAAKFDTAATHVWTASECLTKAGVPLEAPLVAEPCDREGAMLFSCGASRIATLEVTSGTALRVFAFLCSR
jgi:enediyne polyketide synthase